MSYINEALKKAQKEREMRYLLYGGGLAQRGKPRLVFFAGVLGWSLPCLLLASFALISYGWLNLEGRNKAVSSQLKKDAAPEAPLLNPRRADTDQARILYDRARSFHKDGRRSEARRFYQETLRLDPGYVDALNNLGVIYLQEKDFLAAKLSFEKAVLLNPGYADLYYNLACLYAMMGESKESIDHLEKAVSLDPLVRNWARGDRDLENIWAVPEFKGIMGEQGSGD